MGVINIMGQDGRWHDVTVDCLLEVLERRMRKNDICKVVSQMGEARNERVEVCTVQSAWILEI